MPLLKINPTTGNLDLVQDLSNISGDVTILDGVLNIGVDDTEPGVINIFGDGASSNQGGKIKLYTPANYDAVVDHYIIDIFQDDLLIGTETDPDGAFFFRGSDGYVFLSRGVGVVGIGQGDVVNGQLSIYGDNANLGGLSYYYTGANYDTTINYFQVGTIQDDFFIGPNIDVAMIKILDSSAVVINESSNDVDFRVESNGNANMLFVDGGNNRVGIGTGTPNGLFEIATPTEATEVIDAGSAGATEQDWIEVQIGGNTGYIRVFAAK